MTQQGKTLVAKLDKLSWTPRTQVGERESWGSEVSLRCPQGSCLCMDSWILFTLYSFYLKLIYTLLFIPLNAGICLVSNSDEEFYVIKKKK